MSVTLSQAEWHDDDDAFSKPCNVASCLENAAACLLIISDEEQVMSHLTGQHPTGQSLKGKEPKNVKPHLLFHLEILQSMK